METSVPFVNGAVAVRLVPVFTQSFDRWTGGTGVNVEKYFTTFDLQNWAGNEVCVLTK